MKPRLITSLTLLLLAFGATGAFAQSDSGGQLSVSEYGVGTAIENRVLKGKAESFPENTKVFFWTRVVGGAAGDRIRHVWIYDGKEISIGLNIGGPHWRTYSSKMLYPGMTGSWTVEVRDAEDRVLVKQTFRCTGAEGSEL